MKNILKHLISYLYHKFVSKPNKEIHMSKDEYLEVCKIEFEMMKNYEIDTYEKLKTIKELALASHSINKMTNSTRDSGMKIGQSLQSIIKRA